MTNKDKLSNAIMLNIDKIRELISQNMKSNGDKEEDCQQLYLLNRINDFEYAVNGTANRDMKDGAFYG